MCWSFFLCRYRQVWWLFIVSRRSTRGGNFCEQPSSHFVLRGSSCALYSLTVRGAILREDAQKGIYLALTQVSDVSLAICSSIP